MRQVELRFAQAAPERERLGKAHLRSGQDFVIVLTLRLITSDRILGCMERQEDFEAAHVGHQEESRSIPSLETSSSWAKACV
eukprot:840784-Pyramimonas_sp.AAC.1